MLDLSYFFAGACPGGCIAGCITVWGRSGSSRVQRVHGFLLQVRNHFIQVVESSAFMLFLTLHMNHERYFRLRRSAGYCLNK